MRTSSHLINIGQFANGEPVTIELAHFLETRALIQANSGGGKSYAIRALLEQTAGKVQQLVIDRDGEFASLREKFDYVIAAAHGGDALAHPKTAALLARRLLETGVSAILDIYDLKKQDKQSFVQIFCETLVEAPKSLWHPVMIVIDEIHSFCPESGAASASAAVADLASLGRKRGYCLVGATQRLAKLDKDVAAELLNKLIGRTSLDTDAKRAIDELGMSAKDGRQVLRNLKPGEFFGYGPALSNTVERLKISSVITTHHKAGQRSLLAPPKPTAAIRSVLPKLADLPKEAETEARTIEELKHELNETRRQLALLKKQAIKPVKATGPIKPAAPSPESLKIAEARGASRAQQMILKDLKMVKTKLRAAFISALDTALKEPLVKARNTELPAAGLTPATVPRAQIAAREPAMRGYRAQKLPPQDAKSSELTGPEQRILDAIAWLETMTGEASCAQPAVAFLAGYTYGAGSFNNPKSRLNAQNLVDYLPGKNIALTFAGRALAKYPDTPPSQEDLHERVLAKLPGPEQRILRPLLEAYPSPMEGQDVAQAANYVYGAGSFNNPRSRLRSWGLIEYAPDKKLIASKSLFRAP